MVVPHLGKEHDGGADNYDAVVVVRATRKIFPVYFDYGPTHRDQSCVLWNERCRVDYDLSPDIHPTQSIVVDFCVVLP